ncbi:SDR family NAD(P)-dependent oxidoreductase [Hoeflea prorocentri]|uniref:SDR family oxidoreductase n=1 Tax=Hoeflea prorocentri TaxID=1922333 RepID=A0A9X3ZG58_9HYPH|nr:SDR family oxidoreductase [Hoeflea prorocentri]MCY6379409.1 SDR family oxidoreductase [Hoeflea prorocentri]MDA5397210.1 SDR family oxidoreductase [Hoeflea prorocentri]
MASQKPNAVIVTGGSRGIGAAVIAALADSSTSVINFDIAKPSDDQDCVFRRVDLTNAHQIENTVGELKEEFSIVGLVNNAGFSISHSLSETTDADFEKLVPLNMVGPAYCAKAVAETMKEAGWGRIVNVSSRAALGKSNRTAYAATKGAMISMTRVWALELAQHNITVNAVGPGPISTELFEKVNPKGSPQERALVSSIPVGRLGTTADVARAVQFFLEETSGFITGQTLYVCGGLTAGIADI